MNHALFQPLLADALSQVIGVIVTLLVLARWVFSQIQDAKKQAARPRAQQPQQQPQAQRAQQQRVRRPPAAAPPAAAQGAPAGQQADPLRDQVEAFLRRAAGQQQPNQPRAVQRPPSRSANKIEVLVGDERPSTERRTLAEPFRAMNEPATGPLQQPPPRQIGSPQPSLGQLPPTSVAQHVAQHVAASTRVLGEKASQLGQRIIAEDEQFDVQLKSKFDHAVGTLAASGTSGERARPDQRELPVGQIAAMLASREGVRQAVILNEILRRPSDRW